MMNLSIQKVLALGMILIASSMSAQQDANQEYDYMSEYNQDVRSQHLRTLATYTLATGAAGGIAYALGAKGLAGGIVGFMTPSVVALAATAAMSKEDVQEELEIQEQSDEQVLESIDHKIRMMRIASLILGAAGIGSFVASSYVQNSCLQGWLVGSGVSLLLNSAMGEFVVRHVYQPEKESLQNMASA